ncbi:MAG: cobalamin B12-binding domain-containing protein [Pseudomonadota bacterium]
MGSDGKQRPPPATRSTQRRPPPDKLELAIEAEIIPTLLKQLAKDTSDPAREDDGTQMTWLESVAYDRSPQESAWQSTTSTNNKRAAHQAQRITPEEFANMVMADSEEPCKQALLQLRNEGVDDKRILLELLAPTSAELGRRWEQDLADFADVTIGVCRLHQLLRLMHPQDMRTLDSSAHGGRVLLTTAPGEQHSFGLLMAGELLFRAGWYTDIDIDSVVDQIRQKVATQWYELAGISVSGETHVKSAKSLIRDIRKHSCNPDIAIVAGGSLINAHPDIVTSLGADQAITADDDPGLATARYQPSARRI